MSNEKGYVIFYHLLTSFVLESYQDTHDLKHILT